MHKIALLILLCLSLTGCLEFVAGATVGTVVGGVVANDRRSLKTMAQDQNIAYECNLRLLSAKQIKDNRVVATVFNHTVLLIGEVSCCDQKQLAENIVRCVPHVRRIFNEITIGAPISSVTQSQDAWITTKLRGEMATYKCLFGNPIKVVTENGVVYLMGIVTPEQANVAVEVARQTAGVECVVKLFEYTASPCTCTN